MRETRTSSSMRGRRKRATAQRACALLYACPLAKYEAAPHARTARRLQRQTGAPQAVRYPFVKRNTAFSGLVHYSLRKPTIS